MGCGMISNSINVDKSIDTNGNAYHLGASPIAGSGGLPTASLLAHGASNVQPYHMPQLDPYAGMFDMGIPPSVTCRDEYQFQPARVTAAEMLDPRLLQQLQSGQRTDEPQSRRLLI